MIHAKRASLQQSFPTPDLTPRPLTGMRCVAIVGAAICCILVDQTASAIAGTGLPYLQAWTAASPHEASWIITIFNALYYSCILFSPWLMARFGRRRLLINALVGFAGTSLALGFVSHYAVFLFLRALQGGFLGCVFVPAALLLFTSLPVSILKYAPPAFVLISLSGSTLGTVIGGYIADTFGGNSIFIPGCIITTLIVILLLLLLPETDVPQPALQLDRLGFVLLILFFAAAQFLTNDGERRNWLDDPLILWAFILLGVSGLGFIAYELYGTRTPHVNLRMFAAYRTLAVGACISTIVGTIGYSVTTLVSYLETDIGATPTIAGMVVLLRILTYAVGVPLAFFLIVILQKLDLRSVVMIGAIGSALSLFAFAQSMTSTAELASFVGLSLLFGLFFGMMNQPLGAMVIGSMPLPLLAAGIAIYKLSAPIGSMIATSIMQTIFDHTASGAYTRLAGAVTLHHPGIAAFTRSGHVHLRQLVALAGEQAHTIAYAHVMMVLGSILFAVLPLTFLTPTKKQVREQVHV